MTELPAGEVVHLATLFDYIPGSIVSRTLARTPAGTITAFAFDRGQGLSEHTAPCDAFVQVLDGEASITIDGKPVTARTGDLVRMPANVPHALHAQERFKMLLVMIRG
jgi:quercetin dioxygenase-like cupin family protein